LPKKSDCIFSTENVWLSKNFFFGLSVTRTLVEHLLIMEVTDKQNREKTNPGGKWNELVCRLELVGFFRSELEKRQNFELRNRLLK